MKHGFWAFVIGIVAVAGVVAAFASGDADEAADETADNVFLGELDLAERLEIWRNQYRRMTPGDDPFSQDVGTWPAAWDEFSPAWDAAPAERDLATWLVQFSVERIGLATIIRDANGTVLWNGTTDFAKDESADVTLTGALVDESDWVMWEAAREEIERRFSDGGGLRDGAGGGDPSNGVFGLRFTNIWVDTNGDYQLDFAWESNGEVQVFCRAMHYECWTNFGVVTTNDENEVVTNDVVHWDQVPGEKFNGTSDTWDLLGVATVTNGSGSITDTNHVPEYDRVRFYAAAELVDTDGDGLTDGEEWLQSHSNPELEDSDGDGLADLTEYNGGTNPMNSDTDGDEVGDAFDQSPLASNMWWISTRTNAWYQWYHRPDCNLNASSNRVDTWTMSDESPWIDSVLRDVRVSGTVDDAITVDEHGVDFARGVQEFFNRSITNEIDDLQGANFSLSLWDYPDANYYGPNEAKIGDSISDMFRVEWEWWTPIDVFMEPIWATQATPFDNPSGIIVGSNAWFRLDLWPEVIVPETNILWTAIGSHIELNPTNRGSRVKVQGLSAGEAEIHVTVEGLQGSLEIPPFHVKVLPLNVVTAKVGVVVPPGSTLAEEKTRILPVLNGVNGILEQAGLRLVVEEPFIQIDYVEEYYNLVEGSEDYYVLANTLTHPGKFLFYSVGSIQSSEGETLSGLSSGRKICFGTNVTSRIIAHELGHSYGMHDIYDQYSLHTAWVASGLVRESWMQQDWGVYRESVQDIGNLMKRLLMYGFTQDNNGDIAFGTVHGVGYDRNGGTKVWKLKDVEVGLHGMTNSPVP